jgi:hypothetical protein
MKLYLKRIFMLNFKEEIEDTIKFINEIFGGRGSITSQPFKFYDISSDEKGDFTIAGSLISMLTIANNIENVNNELNEKTSILYEKNNKIIKEMSQHLKKPNGVDKNINRNSNKTANAEYDEAREEIRRKIEKIDKMTLTTHLKLVAGYRQTVRGMFYYYFHNLHRRVGLPSAIRQENKMRQRKLATAIKLKNKVQQKLPAGIQRLTEIQWQYCVKTAQKLAAENPDHHEKTLFMMMLFYWLYPRVSELIARPKWMPRMNHFYSDKNGNWWFKVLDKNQKIRHIGVSPEMLEALKRYRISRGFLNPLPSTTDAASLLSNKMGRAITYQSAVRAIIQACFDKVIQELRKDNLASEADTMELATITDLRQTGIWDDIHKRSFSETQIRKKSGENLRTLSTYKYNDSQLKERHQSAKNKKLIERL